MFEPFPKLTRFSHDWTITEKIDGTNAQILIIDADTMSKDIDYGPRVGVVTLEGKIYEVFAGSRNRLLTVGKGDNHGFAGFVAERIVDIVRLLGEGRHFGEWYGQGIGPRGYGVNPKRFALFNSARWTGAELPDRIDVVPILFQGYLSDSSIFDRCLSELETMGSRIAPNFMKPEGIVMYHGPSRTTFKKTFDYDEAGKWAENQERKAS
jgi:hypothetical protein